MEELTAAAAAASAGPSRVTSSSVDDEMTGEVGLEMLLRDSREEDAAQPPPPRVDV